MKLFNTATGAIEPFHVKDNTVSMYVCGVTPYDTTHTGHAFTYVQFDTLARFLASLGHEVRYVQNVTDIDDDILRRAAQIGMPWDQLGREQTSIYLRDMAALNVTTPELYVRATHEIPAMIAIATRLLELGLAYEKNGSVLFRVKSDVHFGQQLTDYTDDEMLKVANERGNNPDDPNKENPLDFVLWQRARPADGEPTGEPSWESPWGAGRPGWHIECSAMSLRYLGEQIDIHGGGSDLIFPHHSCEITQSEHYTGIVPFVRIWMHTAMVEQDGTKMSKSLGNMTFVRDVLREYHPDALRLYLLEHHYRIPWEYRREGPAEWTPRAAHLRAAATAATGHGSPLDVTPHRARLSRAMEEDLDTPTALVSLFAAADEIVAAAEREEDITSAQESLREMASIIGLWLDVSPIQE